MRRILQNIPRRYARHSSFVSGLFNYKVVPGELFPYPTHKLDSDASENVQSLIEQIRSNDKDLNTSGVRIALEYGGIGLGHTAHALVCEELGNNGDSRHLSNIQHCSVASYLLSNFGSKELKGKYLTAMSGGEILMGWTTPQSCGTDISMNTTESRFVDGTFTITGTQLCAYTEGTTHFLVLAKALTQSARDDGPAAVRRNTFFIVERGAAGVTVKDNIITLNDTPAVDVVGVVGEGFKDRMITLFTEQYVYSAALLGTLKRVVQELRESVPARWATNTIASCACITYAMESAMYALTANLDLPTEDTLLEAAVVNAFIQRSTNEWLTLISTATPTTAVLDGCFANARRLLGAMESSDFLNATAACCGLEDFGLLFQQASTLQMMQMRLRRSLGIRDRIPLKDIDCTSLDAAIVEFGEAVESTFVKNTTSVPHQQLLLNRIGEAAGWLYAACASASRAAMCLSKRLPTAQTEKQLATAFIATAVERVKTLSGECCNVGLTADELYKRVAVAVCEDALQ